MMLTLLKKAPITVVGIHEIKHHLRIDHSHDDDYLEGLVGAATQFLENYVGRSLLSKTWQLTIECPFTTTGIQKVDLSFPPVTEIEAVYHVHSPYQKVSAKRYRFVAGEAPYIEVYTTAPSLEIVYKAGYGDYPASIDTTLKQAILMGTSILYENDETDLVTNPTLLALLHPYRVYRLL